MSKEMGLFYPDGKFKSDDEIRKEFVAKTIFDSSTELLRRARALEGVMEVGCKEATFHPKPQYPDKPIVIWHATDIHYGSIRTDYDLLLKHLNILESTPNTYVIMNGDEVDNFNVMLSKASTGVFENPLSPQRQSEAFVEKLKQLGQREKIAVISFGNHNNFMAGSGYEWLETFGRDVRTSIFTSGGLLHLLVGEQHYPIAITHMYWGNCLSGSTRIPIYTPNGFTEMYLKDIIKIYGLENGTFKDNLFLIGKNGEKVKLLRWTKRIKKLSRHIKFKDGLEITSSNEHRFLTEDGLKAASELMVGDTINKLEGFQLIKTKEAVFNYDYGWLIGLYLAEGSKKYSNKDGIRLDIHRDEIKEFVPKIEKIAKNFGATINASPDKDNNGAMIYIEGKIIRAIIETFVKGKTSYDKRLTMNAFAYGNEFLSGILDGWLDGDGHYEKYNNRYDAKICRNGRLVQNLRTICWILGYDFRLTKGHRMGVTPQKTEYEQKFYRIKIRKQKRKYWHLFKPGTTIEKISDSKRKINAPLFDIEVEGELFCLTNGAVVHNSKLNPTNMGKRFWEHEYPEAEVVLLGHTHQSELLTWERGGKERLISIGGTYKQDDRWARQHGIGGRGGQPGHAIVFFPYEHKFIGYKHLEDAIRWVR